MTKAEAQQALNDGHKITHTYFMPDEYIYKKGKFLYDETDLEINETAFWHIRSMPIWNDGYSIYNSNEQEMNHNFKIGDKVVNENIYDGKEVFEVTGIKVNQIEVTGDYSGGTHNVNQSDWFDPRYWKLSDNNNK